MRVYGKSKENPHLSSRKKSKTAPRPKAVTKHKVFRGSDGVNWGGLREKGRQGAARWISGLHCRLIARRFHV